MCLAIFKPFNCSIPKEHLSNGFEKNDDGAGFIVSNGEKVVGRKGFFTFSDFWENYQEYNTPEYATAVHFRWKTHGNKTKDNCHPFRLSDDYMAIHNGVLPWPSDDEHSDTYYFCKQVLRPLCKSGKITNPNAKSILEDFIGSGNKIVIVDKTGTPIFLNEDCGNWDNGIWYSNTGYKDYCSSYYSGQWGEDDDDYGYHGVQSSRTYKGTDIVVVNSAGKTTSDEEIDKWAEKEFAEYDWDNDPEIIEFERKYAEKYGVKAAKKIHEKTEDTEELRLCQREIAFAD